MWQKLKEYGGGFVKVRMTGYSPERFLNLCAARQIRLWSVEADKAGYTFYAELKDYRRVRPLVRKAGVHLKIQGKYGLPFFLHRSRKRKLWAAGAGAFVLLLFVLSRFIWNISVEGNLRFTGDTLLHYLDTLDVGYGCRKSQVDCASLEESIRGAFPEIIWVSARVSGTRLLIHLKENDGVASLPVKDESPRDLAAGEAGTITRMVVRQGKAQVEPGDVVEPGQVLISGSVPIISDDGEVVNVQYVHGDGDIYARTEKTYTSPVSKLVACRTRTGTVRHGLRMRVLFWEVFFPPPVSGDLSWEMVSETTQVRLLEDFYLPVWIERVTAREYSRSERPRTQEELAALAEGVQTRKSETFLKKGVPIMENDVRILDKGTSYEIQAHFVVEEQIGIGQKLEQKEEFLTADERNRDYH